MILSYKFLAIYLLTFFVREINICLSKHGKSKQKLDLSDKVRGDNKMSLFYTFAQRSIILKVYIG